MKYREQIPFFRRELDQIGRPFPTLSFGSFRQVMVREPSLEADAACRQFASTLLWPPMPDDVRLEVCLRLTALIGWLETQAEEQPLEGEIGQVALASFLTDYWRDVQPVLSQAWNDWSRCY